MQCNILLPESSFITLRDGLCSSRRWILVGFVSLSQHLIKLATLYFLGCKTQLDGNGLRVFAAFSSFTLRKRGRVTRAPAPAFTAVLQPQEPEVGKPKPVRGRLAPAAGS